LRPTKHKRDARCIQNVAPTAEAAQVAALAQRDPGVARVMPPQAALIGGPAPGNHDLQASLSAQAPPERRFGPA
jgi:hypothetical protein